MAQQKRPIDIAVTKFYIAMLLSTVALWVPVAVWVGMTQAAPDKGTRQFPYLNVAFCVTWLISIAVTAVILEYARRRPTDAQTTWGEAMVGASVSFFLMFWIWGVVPHQWLTFADNELSWRADKALIGPKFGFTNGEGILQWLLPFDLTYLVVRDIIAVTIYGLTIAGFIAIAVVWQNRDKVAPVEVEQSTYGRPIVREGV